MNNLDINWTLFLPIIVLQLIIQIIAIVDLIKQSNMTRTKKIIWALVILLTNVLGPIAYFVFGRREK